MVYEVPVAQRKGLQHKEEALVVVMAAYRERLHDFPCHFGTEDLAATGRQEGP